MPETYAIFRDDQSSLQMTIYAMVVEEEIVGGRKIGKNINMLYLKQFPYP
ncbi:MAG: hypothetical protein HUJ74_01440 [Lachnospiraceae bacterium]|nr:hypothetical protein [Lachnospiraceae bacterium]